MRILVTGTEGYIGCRLAPILAARGHDVSGLDTAYYREGWLYSLHAKVPLSVRTTFKDLRHIGPEDVAGHDAVVHLAELSNDPLGENSPDVTHDINHHGSVQLARLARDAGVRRFVYASSCSVYGVGTTDTVDETSPVNPKTAYARCKVLVERDLAPMASENFCVTFLRNATAYGASPRMRFDIVLNDLCAAAWTSGRIAMTSDGTPWRPLVHVEDICQAVWRVLEAPAEAVNGQCFNVGASGENYRVRQIAEIVAEVFPGCELSMGKASGDNRSYRVSFEKIRRHLPEFECAWNVRRGAEELRALFERIGFDTQAYESRPFTRLKALRHLRATGQIDERFFWAG